MSIFLYSFLPVSGRKELQWQWPPRAGLTVGVSVDGPEWGSHDQKADFLSSTMAQTELLRHLLLEDLVKSLPSRRRFQENKPELWIHTDGRTPRNPPKTETRSYNSLTIPPTTVESSSVSIFTHVVQRWSRTLLPKTMATNHMCLFKFKTSKIKISVP